MKDLNTTAIKMLSCFFFCTVLVPYLEAEQEILLHWQKPVGEKDFIIGHKSG